MSECCLSGFQWEGTPNGQETKLAENNSYMIGEGSEVAILVIADLFGWTFVNTRLLCDAYAKEVGATVYMPDLYDLFSGLLFQVFQDPNSDPEQLRWTSNQPGRSARPY